MILEHPKPVVVTQPDGTFPGWLVAWQRPARQGEPWRAFVRYERGIGLQHLHWVTQREVRQRLRAD